MINSYGEILKAISNYKLILRKALPAARCSAKIEELGIKRQNIKAADEAKLYQIGLKIVDELEKQLKEAGKEKKTSNSYHGTREFFQDFKKQLSKISVENNRLVHVGQKASSALVDVIQLITISQDKLSEQHLQQIIQLGSIIVEHGSRDQKKIFFNAINDRQEHLFDKFPKKLVAAMSSDLSARSPTNEI